MKIAIITYAFYESTLPLFKHLSRISEVHLYCLFSTRFLTPPSFEISTEDVFVSKIKTSTKLNNNKIPDAIKHYLDGQLNNIHIYIHKPTLINKLLNNDIGHITHHIKAQQYDCLHFINTNANYLPIIKKIHKSKLICSIHESENNRTSRKRIGFKYFAGLLQQKRINQCIHYFDHITFFSNNERNKFIERYPNFGRKTSTIKFGLFETFKYFQTNDTFQHSNYYLYLGYIRAYKGVDFLLNSIRDNTDLQQFDFIIAGKDDMNIFQNYRLNNNISFINKFLKDSEIVNLIKNSKALILPYQNASQSGLPSVAFCFNKPIIYTNVKGLDEYLINNYNGISFSVNNANQLKEAIIKLEDKAIYNNLQKNIRKLPFKEDLSWNKIANKFIKLYKS